jgi:hypothetical protein
MAGGQLSDVVPAAGRKSYVRLVAGITAGDIRGIVVKELCLFPDAPALGGLGLLWINPP